MPMKQRAVAVLIFLGGCALAVGLAVGAFSVDAGNEHESVESSAPVGHYSSLQQGRPPPGLVIAAR